MKINIYCTRERKKLITFKKREGKCLYSIILTKLHAGTGYASSCVNHRNLLLQQYEKEAEDIWFGLLLF
jgi:hypothetical protein